MIATHTLNTKFSILKKSITAALFLFLSCTVTVYCQVTVDWRDVAANNNWENGSNTCNQIGTANSQWWYSGWGPNNSRNRPDCYGNHIINFNNNHELNMSLGSLTFNAHKLVFASGNSSSRTIATGTINFYDHSGTWPLIQNNSGTTHTINASIVGSSTHNIELSASSNSIIFGGTINNNGRTIQIYGNNSSVDATNRYIRLTGVVSGSGILNVSRFGVTKLNGTHSYTGETQIDNGELWIESNGSIASGSGIYLGNGSQLANVAKLWLSNSSGSTNFSNNITINDGNTTTRYLGGLNTSGTHTFSGNIINNSTGGLYLSAENSNGSTTFSGVISGAYPVIISGNGTVILSGTADNSYIGTTTVNSGLLVLNKTAGKKAVGNNLTISDGKTVRTDAANQLGIGTPALVTLQGSGTFNCNGFNQIIALASSSSDALVSLGNAVVTLDNTMTDTYAGKISGTGGVTKSNAGTLILTGANDYTGSTSVSAGTLQLNRSGGNTLPATNNVTVNGGTLKVSTNQTLNNLSVTSGTLVIDAGVTLTINGTYTGGGTITNNGSIVLNTTSFPGSSSTISSMNNLTINRSLGVTLDKDLTLTGTLTLTSGTMDIGNNTLTINSNSISRTSGDIDADNGTLVFTNSSILTVPASTIKSGTIKNLTINGAGIILSNGTTVSGALSLSSGTLDLGNTTLTYSGSNITRSSGDIDADAGNLEFANASAITLPASVIKTGTIANLTMNGAGGVSLGQNITISTSVALSSGILSLGNYNLTMNGTFSGSPGSTCYIKTDGSGSVTKNSMAVSSTPFTFPVGNSAFNKLTITNQTSAADNFGVRVIDEVYDNGTGASGATILSTKPRVKRTWQITKGTGSSNSSNGVDIGFYWESSHESSPAPVSYTVFHHNGTKWQEITTPSAAGTNFTVISGYKGSFSPFAVGDNVTPLPVTWLYNRCETTKSGTGIEWGTAEEKDVKTFTIEKSSSGQSFVPIGSIAGSGNSHTPRHYRFEDKNPNPEGAYYRIKQTDQTGEESYSKTCFANSIKNAPSAIISTTDNEVLITTGNADSETSRYVVYNTAGKIMLKGQFTGSQARIPIGHLMVGFYEITIQSASGNHAQKMLINPK